MLLFGANVAFAWFVDSMELMSDFLMSPFDGRSYVQVIEDTEGVRLVFGKGEPSVDGGLEQLDLFYDIEDVPSDRIPWSSYLPELKAVEIEGPIRPIRMDGWFEKAMCLERFEGLDQLDASELLSLHDTFADCISIESVDLSSWEANKIEDCTQCFKGCSNLIRTDISGLLKDPRRSIDSLRISHDSMFFNCGRLEEVRISKCFALSEKGNSIAFQDPKPDYLDDADGCWYIGEEYEGFHSADLEIALRDHVLGSSVVRIRAYGQPYAAIYGSSMLVFGRGHVDDAYSDLALTQVYRGIEDGIDDFSNEKVGEWRNGANLSSVAPWNQYRYSIRKVASDSKRKIYVTNVQRWFYCFTQLQQADLSSLDLSDCVNMYQTFYECQQLTFLDSADWNLGKVKTMQEAFYGCSRLEELDASHWNPSSLGHMGNSLSAAFYYCLNLREIDMSQWQIPFDSGISMGDPFEYCRSLERLDLSGFWMVKHCHTIWNLSHCDSLSEITISNRFDFSGFQIPTPKSNRNGISNSNYWYVEKAGKPLTNSDVAKDMSAFYSDGVALSVKTYFAEKSFNDDDPYSAIYGGTVQVFGRASEVPRSFDGLSLCALYREIDTKTGESLNSVPWSNWRQSIERVEFEEVLDPSDCAFWFYEYKKVEDYSFVDRIDTSKSTSMRYMFYDNVNLHEMDLSSWCFDMCSDMTSMFAHCSKLERFDCSDWIFANDIVLDEMFASCSNLTSIDLPHILDKSIEFSTINMLIGCSSLVSMHVPHDFCFSSDSIIPTPSSNRGNVVNSNFWYLDGEGDAFDSAAVVHEISKRYGDAFSQDSTWIAEKEYLDEDSYCAIYGNEHMVFDRGMREDIENSYQGKELTGVYRELESQYFEPVWWGKINDYSDEYQDSILHAKFNTEIAPVNCSRWFSNMTALESIDNFGLLDTSNTRSFFCMFLNCKALDCSLEFHENALDSLDTSVNSLTRMFDNCTSLRELDLSNFRIGYWAVRSGTNGMLNNCGNLEKLIIPSTFRFSKTAQAYDPDIPEPNCNRFDIANSRYWYIDGSGYPLSADEATVLVQERFGSGEHNITLISHKDFGRDDAYAATYEDDSTGMLTLVFSRGSESEIPKIHDGKRLVSVVRSFEERSITNSFYSPWSEFYDVSCYTDVEFLTKIKPAHDMDFYFRDFWRVKEFKGIGNIDLSGVDSIAGLFFGCLHLSKIDLSSWDVSDISDFSKGGYPIFFNCTDITYINIAGWNLVKGGSTLDNLFLKCTSLKEVDMSDCKLPNAPNIFSDVKTLERIIISDGVSFSTWCHLPDVGSDVEYADGLWCIQDGEERFTPAMTTETINSRYGSGIGNTVWVISHGDVGYAAIYGDPDQRMLVFGRGNEMSHCNGLVLADVIRGLEDRAYFMDQYGIEGNIFWWDVKESIVEVINMVPKDKPLKVLSLNSWFRDMWQIDSIDVSMFDISQVIDLTSTFRNCSNLSRIVGIEDWDTSQAQLMNQTFRGCSSLESDISNWDVGNVVDHEDFALHAERLIEPKWKS